MTDTYTLSTEPSEPQLDLSSDTRVKWLDDCWWARLRWWSLRRRSAGAWYADHVAFPGAWATGDTIEEALDELASVIVGWCQVRP